MAELALASSALGIVSLGITVFQGLIDYYQSCRTQSADIERVLGTIQLLRATFQNLYSTLKERPFRENEQALVELIERSINNCEETVKELNEMLEKFNTTPKRSFKNSVNVTLHRLEYPFRESTLLKLVEDLNAVRQSISHSLQVLDLDDGSYTRDAVEKIKEQVDVIRIEQVASSIRDWLRAPDVNNSHRRAWEKRNSGSGDWLLESQAFRKWLETSDTSFLWIHGFSGTGKSVLCSRAIQHAFRHRRSNARIGIAYFYFAFGDILQQDASSMLRTLILQLATQLEDGQAKLDCFRHDHSHGIPHNYELSNLLRTLTLKFQDVYIFIDALDESPIGASRNEVLKALEDFRSFSSKGVHMLITSRNFPDIRDAVETYGENISMRNSGVDNDISEWISTALWQRRELCKWSAYHDRIKQALVSRADGVFRWVECQLASIARCPRSEYHLEEALASLPRSLDETYERILLSIDPTCIEDAKRILTLVCFAQRPMEVKEVIDGITVELGDSPKLNLSRRLHDEADILECCPGLIEIENGFDYRFLTPGPHVPKQRQLRIGHLSVQEYLESKRIHQTRAAIFSMRRAMAHAELTQICLVYLLDPALSVDNSATAIIQERPLVRYAATHWHEHYQRTESNSQIEKLIVRLFRSGSGAFCNWIMWHNPDYPYNLFPSGISVNDIPSPIYYASLLGLFCYLNEILEAKKKRNVLSTSTSCNLQINEGKHENELETTSTFYQANVTLLSIQQGEDINVREGRYGDALCAAASNGHFGVVRLLLDNGANINPESMKTYNLHAWRPLDPTTWGENTALHYSSLGGYVDIQTALLGLGANICAINQHGQTIVHSAVRSGSLDAARIVLDHILHLDAKLNRDQLASLPGSSNVINSAACLQQPSVQDLLCYSGDVNNMTPTFYAISSGNMDMVNLLVEKGVRIDTKYRSSPWKQVRLRKDVRYELDSDALKATSKEGGLFPLHAAAYWGRESAADFFLQRGANPNALSEFGQTPLHLALSCWLVGPNIGDGCTTHCGLQERRLQKRVHGEKDFQASRKKISAARTRLRLRLINNDQVDVSVSDCYGRTALHVLRYQDEDSCDLIKQILKRDADVNALDHRGQTPLHLAASSRNIEAVQVYINHDADVSILDKKGLSVLDCAVMKGHSEMVTSLLKHRDIRKFLEGATGQALIRRALGCNESSDGIGVVSPDVLHILLDEGLSLPRDAPALYIQTADPFPRDPIIITFLLEHGGDPLLHDKDGLNLSHMVVQATWFKSKTKVLDLLAANGVDLSALDHQRKNVLHHAAVAGEIDNELLEYLNCKTTVDFYARDGSCMTPLEHAKAQVWDKEGKEIKRHPDMFRGDRWDESAQVLAAWVGEPLQIILET